jgi:hypothetical protein
MNLRRSFANRGVIIVLLIAQIIPLLLFPPESFAPTTQEWWLPMLLVVLVLAADAQLIFRRSHSTWPWYLISFGHGFNIISRLMMIWPHATVNVNGASAANVLYLALTLLAMLGSAFMLWAMELPEVRMTLAAAKRSSQ